MSTHHKIVFRVKKAYPFIVTCLLFTLTAVLIYCAYNTQSLLSFFSFKTQITIINTKQNTTQLSPSPVYAYPPLIAQKSLETYVKRVIKNDFLPQKLTIQNKLSIYGKPDANEYTFGTLWKIKDSSFYSYFNFNRNSDQQSDMNIFVQLSTLPTYSSLKELITSYFNGVTDIKCKTTNTEEICEDFHTTGNVHQGFGAATAKMANGTIVALFACEIPTDTSAHKLWKSCTQRYADGGI